MRRPVARRLTLLLGATGLAIVLAEVGLRLFRPQPARGVAGLTYLMPDQELNYMLKPGTVLGHTRVNVHGLRGKDFPVQPPSGEARIAVLGDSFTIADGIAEPATFCAVLEQKLNCEGRRLRVINGGVIGYGTFRSWRHYERRVRPLGAKEVHLAFFVGNDMTENMVEDPRRQLPVKRRYKETMRHSHLWRLGEAALTMARAAQGEGLGFDQGSFDRIEAQRLDMCRRSRQAAPEWVLAWERTREYLGRLKTAVETDGARLSVSILPDQHQIEPQVRRRALDYGDIPEPDIDLDAPQRRVSAILAELGIPALDLEPIFREAYAADGASLYLLRNTHLNEHGHRVTGLALARFLRGLPEHGQ